MDDTKPTTMEDLLYIDYKDIALLAEIARLAGRRRGSPRQPAVRQ